MPTYEYKCSACGEHLEAFQRMSDEPLVLCPQCGKESLNRVVSGGAGVIYRGEGWYVTDYSGKSSGGKDIPPKSDDKSAATTPTESKGESSTKPSEPKDVKSAPSSKP